MKHQLAFRKKKNQNRINLFVVSFTFHYYFARKWNDEIKLENFKKSRKILSMRFISCATGLHLNQFHASNLTSIFHPIIIAIWIAEECRKHKQQTIKTEDTNNDVEQCAHNMSQTELMQFFKSERNHKRYIYYVKLVWFRSIHIQQITLHYFRYQAVFILPPHPLSFTHLRRFPLFIFPLFVFRNLSYY